MATEIIRTVKSSGGHYTSLSAWEAGEQGDLPTLDEIHTAECYSFQDTAAAIFTGWTTDATRYIKVIAASGSEAIKTSYDTSRYRLEVTDSNSITVQEEYARFVGLQVKSIYSASDWKYCFSINFAGGASDIRLDSCRIETSGAGNTGGVAVTDADFTVNIYNCIINAITRYGIYIGDGNANIYNSTLYDCATKGIIDAANADTVVIKNCAVFNTADDFDVGNGTSSTIDYCASDDNDGTNNVAESGGGAAWPDDFNDAANGDFTLKSGSNLVGAGVDDPGSGLYSDDIDGETRTTTWDIGADEYVAAGGADVGYLTRKVRQKSHHLLIR